MVMAALVLPAALIEQYITGDGVSERRTCHVATVVAGTLATSFSAGSTIDGVVLSLDDRILIKDQASAVENGIYKVTAGAPDRAPDLANGDFAARIHTRIKNGTVNANKSFYCSSPANADVVGTNNLIFTQDGDVILGSQPNFDKIYITSTSNQIILGTTNTATISASPSSSATYTIPNVASASFVMTEGNQTINGIKTFTTPIAATSGGTGIASYTIGDILVADSSTTLTKYSDVATGNVLLSGGVGVAPLYGKVTLTGHVSGILPVANGGTNSGTALNNNRIMISSGGQIVEAAALLDGQLLVGTTGGAPTATTITAGSGIVVTNGAGSITISTAAGGGTVTSVGLSAPSIFTVSGSPVTGAGTLTFTSNTQSANTVYSGPTTGIAAIPTFRSLVVADLPTGIPNANLANSSITITAGTGLTGGGLVSLGGSTSVSLTVPVIAINGGTGQTVYAVGDLLYANTTTTLAKLADIATGNVLLSGGVGVAPAYGKVTLTGHVSGILPIANGGTNSGTTLNNNRIMVSSGGQIVEVAALTNGQILVGSTGGAPTAATITAGTAITITNGAGSIQVAVSVVPATNGGTGQTSYTIGDLLYADTATTLAKLADIATGNVLLSGGVGVAPAYGKVTLTGHVSGILPIANGGTNSGTALNNNRIMVSSGGQIVEAAALTNGQILVGSTGGAPTAATITAGAGISVTNGAGSITIASTGVTSISGTANQVAVSASTGSVVISTPNTFIAPGSIQSTTTLKVGTIYADTPTILAATGTTQGTAAAITTSYTVVSTVTTGSATGIILPAGTGFRITIINKSGNTTTPLSIYPNSGANINALAVNIPITVVNNNGVTLESVSGTQWYTITGSETWNQVLSNGNVSGGVIPTISTGDYLQYVSGVRIGGNNVAPGATGTNSISIGSNASASSSNAIAVGNNVSMSGDNSVLIGSAAASGNSVNAVIYGPSNTIGNGSDNTTVVGCNNTATSPATQTAILGFSNSAGTNASQSTIAGNNNALGSSSSGAIVIGTLNNATGSFCTTIGYNNTNSGSVNNVILGPNNNIPAGTGLNNYLIGANNSVPASTNLCSILGYSNTASGANSVTVGCSSGASTSAVAIGDTASASTTAAIAIGLNSTASGANSVAIGNAASTNSSTNAVVVGNSAIVGSGANSGVAIGNGASITTLITDAIAIRGSVGGNSSIAIGLNSSVSASAASAIAIGNAAVSTNTGCIAIGNSVNSRGSGTYNTVIGGSSGIAAGTGATNILLGFNVNLGANINNAVLIGNAITATVGSDAIGIGTSPIATGATSIAIGAAAKSISTNDIAIGNTAQINSGSSAIAIGPNALVDCSSGGIAIGAGAQSRSTSANNVVVGVGSTIALGSGSNNQTVGTGNSTAANLSHVSLFGDTITATGDGSTAVGAVITLSGTNAIAMGTNLTSSGAGSIVIGNSSASATAANTVVIGNAASAAGSGSIVFGVSATTSTSVDGIAIGNSVTLGTLCTNGVAIGRNAAIANGITNAIAIRGSVSGNTSIAIGSGTNTNTATSSVAIGDTSTIGALSGGCVSLGLNSTIAGSITGGVSVLGSVSGSGSISIGVSSSTSTSVDGIAIGNSVTLGTLCTNGVAIGRNASVTNGTTNAIAIRGSVGGTASIAIGVSSNTNTATSAVAIGNTAVIGTGANSSVAIGASATIAASTTNAIALRGFVSGNSSIAIGISSTTSTAVSAIAIGDTAQISAGANSTIAIGASATAANGGCVAIGNNVAARGSGTYNTVIGGVSAIAAGTGARNILLGYNVNLPLNLNDCVLLGSVITSATIGNTAIGIGQAPVPSGTTCIAIGNTATAAATNSVAIGNSPSIASGATSAVAIGTSTSITGSATGAIAILGVVGGGVSSIAIGTGANTNAAATSVALGATVTVSSDSGVSIGTSVTNAGTGKNNTMIGSSLSIAAGTSAGCTIIGTSNTNTTANLNSIIMIGNGNAANAVEAIVIGRGSNVLAGADGGISIGNLASVRNQQSIALGVGAVTGGIYSISIGNATTQAANADRNVCVGSGISVPTVSSASNTIIGDSSVIGGIVASNSCVALGANITIPAGVSNRYYFSSGWASNGRAGGSAVGVLAGGEIVPSTSSIRFKQNVRPLKNPEDILKLKAVKYNPKRGCCACSEFIPNDAGEVIRNPCDGTCEEYVGAIAEQLDEVGLGDYVVYEPDPDNPGKKRCRAIQYDKLVCPLIEVVKNQQATINELNDKMNYILNKLSKM